MDGADAAKVVDSLDHAKWQVVAIVCGFAFLLFIAYVLKWYFETRKSAALEIAKQRRADQYQKTTNEQTATLQILFGSVGHTLNKVETVILLCTERLDGKLNFVDSLKIVTDRFSKVIAREVCIIFERSLTMNDYENRSDFIRRKVKTNVSDILVEARIWLAGIKTSFDTGSFFKLQAEGEGERFVLCDMLWDAVEPCFKDKTLPLENRIEEACLLIDNTIHDYLVSIPVGSASNAATPIDRVETLVRKRKFGVLKEAGSQDAH